MTVQGGRAATAEQKSTESLERSADEWLPGPVMQHSRTALAATCVNDQLYVIGGQVCQLYHTMLVCNASAAPLLQWSVPT